MNAEFRIQNGELSGLKVVLLTVVLFATILTGCESQPTEIARYKPEPVLSGYLYNGEPFEAVYLERVSPFEPSYDPQNSGIRNASIRVMGGGDTLDLIEDPAFHGRYIPISGQNLVPKSKVRYRIEAMTPANEFIWAETVVPDTFAWVNIFLMDQSGQRYDVSDGDTLTRDDPLMFWEWSGCDSAGGYAGTIVALTDRDSLVPLDPDWDAEVDSVKMEERTRAGYTVMREDQRRISIAWIFFNWEGPTRIELQAVSKDYYEYLFSSFWVQQGMAEKALSNVHGGLGIFSGIARKSLMVYMKRVG